MGEAQALFDRYATPACPEELHGARPAPGPRPRGAAAPRLGRQGRRLAGRRHRAVRGAERRGPASGDRDPRARPGDAGLPLTLGTGPKVTRALIPAAGFGTRLFPASKATKKELFPVVDRDGIAKPAILLIVEEALEAGIEEVVIVVQEQDLEDFRSFFNQQISIENYNKLPRHFQEYARRILEIGRRVTFVTQAAPGRVRPRGLLRPRGARRRALPADAGRPPLPLDGRPVLRAPGAGRLPALGHERRRPAAHAGGARSPPSGRRPASGSSRSGCSTSRSSRRSPPRTTRGRACACRASRRAST